MPGQYPWSPQVGKTQSPDILSGHTIASPKGEGWVVWAQGCLYAEASQPQAALFPQAVTLTGSGKIFVSIHQGKCEPSCDRLKLLPT